MAKRRAEETLLHDSPSKRCYRSRCSVDTQLQSAVPTGGVSLRPPSLPPSLGNSCRKRPRFFEEPGKDEEATAAGGEAAGGGGGGSVHHRTTHCDTGTHVADVVTVQTSGSFQQRRSSSTSDNPKKRAREESACPKAVNIKANEEPDADANTEDSTYNSFQYWRVPLPELDLSLLELACDRSKAKVKKSSEAMET